MTHTTTYETRDGKTYRAKDAPPAPSGEKKSTAAPEVKIDAEPIHAPVKPVKQGA
jgi:hypothetical protein